MDAFVARQPIFDRERDVFGYELLFRSGRENSFGGADGDDASTAVISNSLHVHGMESLTAGKRGFINVTRNLLLNDLISVLPSQLTVVELLETIRPDDQVIEACRELRKAGYLVAMDDFVFDPQFERLLHEVDIVKVDFMGSTRRQREDFARTFSGNGTKLLAEKVETHQEFQEGLDLGYSYFQGYFFCKPQVVQGRDLPTSKIGLLRFMQQINQPDIDYGRLEDVIKSEVSLSVKLLKYLNSPSVGVRSKVTSIRQALVLLGVRPLRKWASLMAITGLKDDKPVELLVTCLARARFCELMAAQAAMRDRELDLFLTGMLSTIDALVDRPMDAVLAQMSLADDVRLTLLGRSTRLTPVYQLALALERGEWESLAGLTSSLGVASDRVSAAYRDAIVWADQFSRE